MIHPKNVQHLKMTRLYFHVTSDISGDAAFALHIPVMILSVTYGKIGKGDCESDSG